MLQCGQGPGRRPVVLTPSLEGGLPSSAAAGRPRRAGGEGCASWGLSEPVKGLCAQPHKARVGSPQEGRGPSVLSQKRAQLGGGSQGPGLPG